MHLGVVSRSSDSDVGGRVLLMEVVCVVPMTVYICPWRSACVAGGGLHG